MNKVYVVIGGWDYEGPAVGSALVFSTREKAEEHGVHITVTKKRYDYYHIVETQVDPK